MAEKTLSKETDKKTISLSFDSDCIIIDDELPNPKRSLDGITIDLTNEYHTIMSPKMSKASVRKTIEYNMNLSECISFSPQKSSPLRTMDQNNNMPTCSKYLTTNPKPVETFVSKGARSKHYLLENTEEFVCSLCLNFILPKLGVTLRECQHNFCRQCLIQTIYTKYDAVKGIQQCPLEMENCNKNIHENELKELLGNDNFIAFQLQTNLNMENQLEIRRREKEEDSNALLPLLLHMNDVEIIPNFKKFDCPICFIQIDVGEGIILQNCTHQFCRECLIGCVDAAEEFEVICPFIENNLSCKAFLQDREIRAIVPKDTYEKLLIKSLKLAENSSEASFHCRTPDCPSFVEIGEEVNHFSCPVCKQINCVPCKAIHQGKSCLEYQEEQNPHLKEARMENENFKSMEVIQELIKTEKAMYCPRCNIPVEKISGCDNVKCTACKLEICWVTKKPRRDLTKTNGTIIEGCRCNEGPLFQKCHPKCGNCH